MLLLTGDQSSGRRNDLIVAIKQTRPTPQLNYEWTKEMNALELITDLHHDHIVQWYAAFSIDTRRFLMFEWADGGNLWDFWEKESVVNYDIGSMRTVVYQSLEQFRGLAHALAKLHIEKKFRHGDIKPQNILRFKNKTLLGLWKIADFGLARRHNSATRKRFETITKSTTVEYEAPEAFRATSGFSSLTRLCDLWSVGGLILEHVIWLLHGFDELKRFRREVQGLSADKRPLYEPDPSGTQSKIRPVVKDWLDTMRSPCRGTALGDLLDLVESNLLVVIPEEARNWEEALNNGIAEASPLRGVRASAPELYRELCRIMSKVRRTDIEGSAYLFPDKPRQAFTAPRHRRTFTHRDSPQSTGGSRLHAGHAGAALSTPAQDKEEPEAPVCAVHSSNSLAFSADRTTLPAE